MMKEVMINNIQDLQKIGNDPNYPLDGEYVLTQDIDASDTVNWNNGSGFVPIGTESNPFIGKFNGNGYKIHRLHINRFSQSYIGLFGCIGKNSEVLNLGIEEGWVIGGDNAGILVGSNGGIVRNCYSTGNVSGKNSVGGLIGTNRGTVLRSYSTCSVTGDRYVGGFVGWNGFDAIVGQSYSMGGVLGCNAVGGLVGYNKGIVSHCYSICSTSGYDRIGRLIGFNYEGTVSQSYGTGSVRKNK